MFAPGYDTGLGGYDTGVFCLYRPLVCNKKDRAEVLLSIKNEKNSKNEKRQRGCSVLSVPRNLLFHHCPGLYNSAEMKEP